MLSLVWGDMNWVQRQNALCVAGLEGVMAACYVAVALLAKRRVPAGRDLNPALQFLVMLLPVGYLCATMFAFADIVPASAALWILPPQEFFYHQFAFAMPGLFYGVTLLACFPAKRTRKRDLVLSICATVGIPLGWAAVLQLFRFGRFLSNESLFPWVIAAFVGSTVVMGVALIRSLVSLYGVLRERGRVAMGLLSFLVGVAAPVGGLLLNRDIPFPADFQSPGVYALAVINGLALLLPTGRAGWLVRCASLPFTLYFLVVFLPFLPLSILAIAAAGAGFLILAPVLLFLIHGQCLIEDYRRERAGLGKGKAVLIGLAMFSIMPAYFVAETARDRVTIRHALDYVYAPDYRAWGRFDGSPTVLRRSLLHLRDFKAGKQLPFLSGFYHWLAFDNLVLPDDKMQRLHRVFFGSEMAKADPVIGGIFEGRRPGAMSLVETRNGERPPTTACQLDALEARSETNGSDTRTLAILGLRNTGAVVGEYVTRIALPEGVLVSGFWLHIGEERVPGRVFEKKTALWVYQKIRDVTRRDPGILLFDDPHTVELRVFPLAAGEKRTVEIEFLSPPGGTERVKIGDRSVDIAGPGDGGPGVWLAKANPETDAALIGRATSERLPVAKREPYLHFIANRSGQDAPDAKALSEMMGRVGEKFPAAREGRITFANYECLDGGTDLRPIEDLGANPEALPARGGFLAEAAIKRALLQYHDAVARAPAGSPWLKRYPVVVILGDPGGDEKKWKLGEFARWVPDAPEAWICDRQMALRRVAFSASGRGEYPRPVAVVRRGETNALLPVGEAGLATFAASSDEGAIKCLDAAGTFVPIDAPVKRLPPESPYGGGMNLWLESLGLGWNPSLERETLPRLVRKSRDTGVMIAATSYIVVENSAQWEVLRRKEKTKLRNNSELEIEAVPEPSAVLMIATGLAAAAMRRRRRR
jgi:hypothetical protein